MAKTTAERFGVQTIQKLSEIEELAEEILTDRQQIVDLDRKRNGNREAISALKGIGSRDQKTLDEEIDSLRKNMKSKVVKLHELEGLPEVKGFGLKSLTDEDLTTVKPNAV